MSGLLLAPYNDSMRLGQGFNSFLQTPCVHNAVKVRPNCHFDKLCSETDPELFLQVRQKSGGRGGFSGRLVLESLSRKNIRRHTFYKHLCWIFH